MGEADLENLGTDGGSCVTPGETEYALRESDERFRALSEATFEGIAITRHGMILDVNKSLLDMTGYERSELINMSILDLAAPESRKVAASHIVEGSEEPYEAVVRRKNGTTFIAEGRGKRITYMGRQARVGAIIDITKRKQVERALQESEREYRTLADNTPEVIARFDRQLRHTYINEYGAKVYGLPKEEVIGKTNADLGLPPDKVAYWREHIEQVLATAEQQTVDFDFHSPAFGHQFFSSLLAPERNDEGEVVSVLAISRDVTSLRRIEEALRESEARLQATLESIPDELWIVDAEGRVVLISNSVKEHLGIGSDRFPDIDAALDQLEVLRPDGTPRPRDDALLERSLRGDFIVNEQELIRNLASGELRWREVNSTPIRDANDRIVGAVAIARDITERVEAQRALEAERARLRTVLETLPVGVFIANAIGQVVEMNPAAKMIWGQDAPMSDKVSRYAEYKGWWPNSGERLASEDWALARALTNGETITGEVIDIERFDGARATVLNSAAPIRDDQGQIVGAVVTVQDITDLRVAEDQLRQSRDLLQSVIDNIPAVIYVKDPDGTMFLVNNALSELTRRTKEELIGNTAFDLYPREVAEQHTENDREVMRRGKPVTFEETVPKDGSTLTFLSIKFPLRDTSGRIYGIGGVSYDITARVRTEHALARALDESRRDRERLEAMESIADAGISATELDEVLCAVAEKIAEALGSHSCTILLLDDTDELVAHAAYGIPEEIGFRIGTDAGFMGKILSTRRTVYIKDAEHDPLVTDPHVKRVGAKSLLGTPLIARGQLVGILYVDLIEVREFDPEERRLLETMASRTALIVGNAKLYEGLAKSRDEVQRNFTFLQRSLLPPEDLEVGPGYRMAGAYLSPFGLEIGGDFYDVFDTENGKHGILIGDVAGKGVPAVSLATATRSTIHALAYDIPSVGEALSHANAVLCPQEFAVGESTFVTALIAVIDPATGEFHYAGAGHPPPAIYHGADGTVEFLEAGGPPLRVAPGVTFEERLARLSPGDKMILYTDGLSEARRGIDLFGFEGIRGVLEEHGHLDPRDVATRLIEAASEYAGRDITDDTAIVVVERLAGEVISDQSSVISGQSD